MKKNGITEYFEEVETERKYNGYFCWIPEVITIAILGSMCGLRNASQIHQWAASERVSGFLKEKFAIEHVPYARMEWSVETMHWLLDVHFEEDWCRIENKKVQQHLNMFRKAAINIIKLYKSKASSKKAISHIMLECSIDEAAILKVVTEN